MNFDINEFKRQVKQWVQQNPNATAEQLTDLCEELIPTQSFQSHKWIIDQTVQWFGHVQQLRAQRSLIAED